MLRVLGFTKGNKNSMRRGRKLGKIFILTVLIFMRIYRIYLYDTKNVFWILKNLLHMRIFKKGKSIKKNPQKTSPSHIKQTEY